MAKRKKQKNNPGSPPSGKFNFVPFVFIGVISAALGTVYYMSRPPEAPIMVTGDALHATIETKPLLSPALFTGRAALAYQYAAEIPGVIDNQFCYCYCKKYHGHKSLLTCFTNDHGANCDICIEEVLYAYELHKNGKSIADIIRAIEGKFYQPDRHV